MFSKYADNMTPKNRAQPSLTEVSSCEGKIFGVHLRYLASVKGGWSSCGSPEKVEGILVVLMSEFHFCILAPDTGKVVHIFEGDCGGLIKNNAGIL